MAWVGSKVGGDRGEDMGDRVVEIRSDRVQPPHVVVGVRDEEYAMESLRRIFDGAVVERLLSRCLSL